MKCGETLWVVHLATVPRNTIAQSHHTRTFHVIVPRIPNLFAATIAVLFSALSVHIFALCGDNNSTLGIKKCLHSISSHIPLYNLGTHFEKLVYGLLDATVVAPFGNRDGSVGWR